MCVAVTALVGRYIGMGRPDIAVRRAHLGFAVTGTYMFACGVFFFVFRTENTADSDDDPITGPLRVVPHEGDPTDGALQGPLPPPERDVDA